MFDEDHLISAISRVSPIVTPLDKGRKKLFSFMNTVIAFLGKKGSKVVSSEMSVSFEFTMKVSGLKPQYKKVPDFFQK